MQSRTNRLATAVVAILGALLGSMVVAQAASAASQDGELVADGAWCWFQDPRAVHHVGAHDRTYVAYVTSGGDIEIISQDAGTAELTRSTLNADFQKDDHAAPGILVQPDGRIAVVYSKHTGAELLYQVSTNPEDVSSFGPPRAILTANTSSGLTYGNPIYLPAEGRTYVFFRGQDAKPTVIWSDDLVTWSSPVTVLKAPAAEPDNRPYVKYSSNGYDTILLSFTDGHPRNEPENSIYSMTLRGGVFRTVEGNPIARLQGAGDGLPGAPVSQSMVAKIYDGAGLLGKAWVWSTAFDQAGHPVIAFATFPTDEDHRYWYARWSGTAWVVTQFAAAGGTIQSDGKETNYSGGMDLDPNDPSVLYTSRQIGQQWEIERWTTLDGGATFSAPTAITSGSSQKNVRPVVPWGPPGEVEVLWMAGRYTNWNADYDTQLRELTSGLAPTSTRISTSMPVTPAGGPLTVSARVVQGYEGTPVTGVSATLYAQTAGLSMYPVATAQVDATGLVSFPVTQSADTQYQVRFGGTTQWGVSTSPTATVLIGVPTATRLSVSRTTTTPQLTTRVGIRAVSATTNVGVPNAQVELWQRTGTGPWFRRLILSADANGLAQVDLRPSTTVTYQARFPASPGYGASQSTSATLTVKKATATRISLDRTTSTPLQPVVVGGRVVDAVTGVGIRGVTVELWQKVSGGTWTLRHRGVTDSGGLLKVTLRPDRSLSYQMRFNQTATLFSSTSPTASLSVVNPTNRTRVS